MPNLLILSQWCDYLATSVYHYSISKGFNIGAGFALEANTYYMTLGETKDYELTTNDQQKIIIHLKNANEITTDFLDTLDYILFIKEVEMFGLLEKMPTLKALCLRPYSKDSDSLKRRQKIGIKSDSLAWIRSENTVCKKLFGFDCHEFAVRCLDLLYVQTPEFKTVDFKRFGGGNQHILKKIVISPMGVNNYIEKIQDTNPYTIDHSYCVTHFDSKMTNNQIALYPLPLIPLLDLPNDNPEKIAALADFNRKKTILIYSGRLKMDGAIDMLKNIMKELGNDYELHIFPGSFNIPAKYRMPNEENIRYSGRHSFSVLRDRIFNDSTNIIIHHPFTEAEKGKYLTFSNIGLDFSQSRPNNVKSCQGNCKLLEYCYYGLKVVAEKNINNSYLVTDGKNGILLDNIGTVQDYVKAIKKMETTTIDSEFTKMQTIRKNNWDIIAKNVLQDFHNYMG
jgi:hypothetical protein